MRASKRHSLSGEPRRGDKSGHGNNASQQGALTVWRAQTETQVRTQKEFEPTRGTHHLESTERQVRTRKEYEPAWDTHHLESPNGGTSQDTECEREIDEGAQEEISRYQYSFNSSDAEWCITTHPERRKGHYAYAYYYFYTHNALFQFSMCSISAVNFSYSHPDTHTYVPCNGLLHAELQIVPLDCHKHEGDHVVTEFVGGLVNEISTLALLVHFWSADFDMARVM